MRCFIAAWPSPEAIAVLCEMPRPRVPKLRWLGPEQWHVTLRFLGDLTPDEVGEVVGILTTATAQLAGSPVPVAVAGPATGLLGSGLVICPVAGLGDLASVVCSATAGVGQTLPVHAFLGHITLARASRGTTLRPYARALQLDLSAQWTVGAIDLVQSHLRPDGARYDTVARFGLT